MLTLLCRQLPYCRVFGLAIGVALFATGCGPRSTVDELDYTRGWELIDLPRSPANLSPELNLLVWHNYISPQVVRRFEETYGVKVRISYFSENEELYKMLQVPGARYDIVMPGTYMVQQLIREGQLRPLSSKALTNKRHIASGFYGLKHDPGLKYSVPYYCETVGIAFNVKYASGLPLTWAEFILEAPQLLAKGRIAVVDEMRTALGTALLALGYSPNTQDPAEIARARDLLIRARTETGMILELDNMSQRLISEDLILATAWTGDAGRALASNHSVRFVVPRGRSITEIDSFCIPTNASSPETAEFFINYLLIPEVTGAMTNYSYFANTSSASRAFVSPLILNGPAYMEPLPNSSVSLEDVGGAADLYRTAWKQIAESPRLEAPLVPLPFPRTQATSVRR